MLDKQEMFTWAEAHKDEQLALLKELAAIPAPSHHEEKRVTFIRKWLEEKGAEGVIVDEALNVILPFPGKTDGPWTVFTAHTDVVFPDLDPLPVVADGDYLRAPGVGDDTANVVALMLIAEFLLEKACGSGMPIPFAAGMPVPFAAGAPMPFAPEMPMLFVFNSCEEGLGNLKGIRQICKDWQVKQHVSFDLGLDGLVCRAVGSERWKVTAKTVGGHSFGSFGNPNAIAALSEMISELYRQPVPAAEGRKTTYNVGTISGGTSVNTIAQSAEMLYEYRSDDVDCLAQMRAQFFAVFDRMNCEATQFEKELVGERPCGRLADTRAEEALLDRCAALIHEVTGNEVVRRPSSTDCNIPLSLGIPSTCLGLYYGAGAHTREEYIKISSLQTGLKTGMLVVADLCYNN